MPWGPLAGVVGAVGGAAVSSAMAPSTSGSSSYYVPTGLSGADQTWQGLLQSLQGSYYNNAEPQNSIALNSEGAGINAANQYGGAYQNAANSAAGTYGGLASTLNNQANSDYGTASALLNAGANTYANASGANPAQYNLSLNNLTQQTGATNSMYGLGSSAAGAGVQDQALSNFNIGWNTQQIQNQIAGLGAYGQAANQAGQYLTAGNQAAEAAPGYALMSGSLPYTTAQTIAATPGSLASTYGSYLNSNLYGPAETIQQGIIPYMNAGVGAEATPYGTAATNAQGLGSTVSSAIGGLGTAYQNAGSLGNLLNGTTGSYGSGDFSGAFTSSPYYQGGGNSAGFTTGLSYGPTLGDYSY
jgi:hypothetical protein